MSQKVTLDDMDMRARLRPQRHAARPAAYVSRPAAEHSRKLFQDPSLVENFQMPQEFTQPVVPGALVTKTAKPAPVRQAIPVAPHKPEPSRVLKREPFKAKPAEFARDLEPVFKTVTPRPELHRTFAPPPKERRIKLFRMPKGPGLVVLRLRRVVTVLPARQKVLTGLAALVFVVGVGISLSQFRSNHLAGIGAAKASVAGAVPATTTDSDSTAPSTAAVTADTLRSYRVAPDAARYIRIGKLGVLARVLQVGVTKDGKMATPSNVFDAAWYKDSAKPGQPGATLIDGHVSSWSTNGVFYDIKSLKAGDDIEIERGDGKKLNYSVVQTVKYPKDNVDMNALMKPVTPGKSGLNLITCGGKYDSKSNEFSERIAVYATLN